MRLLFQGLFVVAHVAVLTLFIAGLLGRYVSPQTAWWLQPFAIVLPAIALTLFIFTPFAVGMRMWILAAASVALLLVFGWRYVEAVGGGTELNDALTIATLNAGGGDDGLVDAEDRGLAALLTGARPDVACVQEFSVAHRGNPPRMQIDARIRQLVDSLGYQVVAPAALPGHRRPPPIFTTIEVEQKSVVGLPSRHGDDPAGTLVRAQLSYEGRSFAVYNVHLQSFTTRRPWMEGNTFNLGAWFRFLRRSSLAFLQRADESVAIRKMLDDEERPFLLCGDFNTTPHQWTYTRLSSGLQDAYRSAGGLWGPTFPAAWPLVRIDYIIASRHWRIGDARVGRQLAPDHRPVIATLDLDGES